MSVTDILESKGIRIIKNADTSKISSIKAGGIAKYMITPKNLDEFVSSLRIIWSLGEKYKILGGCTNVFFSDSGYDGFIVSTKELESVKMIGSVAEAEAGASLSKILRVAANNDIRIASELFGIPGSFGGALRNNSGAFGADISEIFLEGLFLDKENGRVLKLNGGDLNFSYRSSVIKYENLIFLKGKLRGSFAKKENVLEQFCAFTKTRHNTQPKEYSLGSFFKRGKDYYASKLIDEAGLRGFSVGGASVSEKHAGFIINRGFATASDINELAEIIEKKIYQNYSITLEREAEFVL